MQQKTKPQKVKPRKTKELIIIILCMLLVTLPLAFWFYLMLYFPGTPQTLTLFNTVIPYWLIFSHLVATLKFPLVLFQQGLNLFLPPHPCFPEMPAAQLMALINHKPLETYTALYPGKVEWLTLLAIPFWNFLLLTLHLGIRYLQNDSDLPEFLKQSKALLQQIRDTAHQEIPTYAQPRKTMQKNAGTTSQAPTAPDTHVDSKTHARLTQTRNLSMQTPNIQRFNSKDWENYKQQEGDMMIRDMIRQLQMENFQLYTQKKQVTSTFSQYFSPQVIQYLEQHKSSFQKIENQKQVITVMFCDIRGFSTIAQKLPADELIQYLTEYFDIANYYILHKHHGIINKLMGDGLMSYWGFPVSSQDSALIATSAAIDILREIELRNQTKPDAQPLHIGIGIATGEVIIGNVGSLDFKDFTLIGPPVNMAARLEEANKSLKTKLLISEATYKALNGRIPCKDCGKINIRGWQAPEHVYSPKIG